jgi:hypothetical protein
MLELEQRQLRRLALTVPARDAPRNLQAGAWRNHGAGSVLVPTPMQRDHVPIDSLKETSTCIIDEAVVNAGGYCRGD